MNQSPQFSIQELEDIARTIREHILSMLTIAKSGHSAGSLGMADVFTALYFNVLHHDPSDPFLDDRDRLILSCGHICPVLYATLAEAGYFSITSLQTLRAFGSPLQGHPNRLDLAGVEVSSGPLGQGVSQAVGIALALRYDHSPAHVYCVSSDGEQNEGQVWEAVLFAAKENLSNLTLIIDRNHIQIDGFTSQVLPLEPLREKYESFGWIVKDVDGHDLGELMTVLSGCKHAKDKPTCIIAHTIPGKGTGLMENKVEWHGKPPSQEEAYQAILELRSLNNTIDSEL